MEKVLFTCVKKQLTDVSMIFSNRNFRRDLCIQGTFKECSYTHILLLLSLIYTRPTQYADMQTFFNMLSRDYRFLPNFLNNNVLKSGLHQQA